MFQSTPDSIEPGDPYGRNETDPIDMFQSTPDSIEPGDTRT